MQPYIPSSSSLPLKYKLQSCIKGYQGAKVNVIKNYEENRETEIERGRERVEFAKEIVCGEMFLS